MVGASIDLGSNSFICLIFESQSDSKSFDVLHDEIILTRLSEGVDETGKIAPAALFRSEQAFQKFAENFKKFKVEKVLAVATSAARDAKNQAEFLNLAEKYNIPVQILSGNEEAQMTFKGVQGHFEKSSGVVIDIGGGSTEFILVQQGRMEKRVSLDLGVVRFSERYKAFESFKDNEQKIVEGIIKELKQSHVLNTFKEEKKVDLLLAVSGTPTNAASLMLGEFAPEKIEGFALTQKNLENLKLTYSYLPLTDRLLKFPFVEPKRADVLPVGLAILEESMKYFGLDHLKVSTQGIRHGAAQTLLGH